MKLISTHEVKINSRGESFKLGSEPVDVPKILAEQLLKSDPSVFKKSANKVKKYDI